MLLRVEKVSAERLDDILGLGTVFFYESDNKNLTLDLNLYKESLLSVINHINHAIFMVFNNEEPVGYIIVYQDREFTVEFIGEIYQYYILPEYRGTKAFTMLRDAVNKQFQDWGVAKGYMTASSGVGDVKKNNQLIENAWRKSGYTTTGLVMTKEFK